MRAVTTEKAGVPRRDWRALAANNAGNAAAVVLLGLLVMECVTLARKGDTRLHTVQPMACLTGCPGNPAGFTEEALNPEHHSALLILLADPTGAIFDGSGATPDAHPGAPAGEPQSAVHFLRAAWRDAAGDNGDYWVTSGLTILLTLFLGMSLWYVTQRLYGYLPGLLALALLCTSPVFLLMGANAAHNPALAWCWGVYGAVFSTIAVAHTLYAPRAVILWNVRRIILLGISLALAIGCDYVFVILIPILLGILWYLAPIRKGAASVILLAACGVATVLLWASYGFNPHTFLTALQQVRPFATDGDPDRIFSQLPSYKFAFYAGLAAEALIVPAIVVALLWKRARYFGNIGPLMVAAILIAVAAFTARNQGWALLLAALPLLFQVIAGVVADLLETRARRWLGPALVVVLIAGFAFSIRDLFFFGG